MAGPHQRDSFERRPSAMASGSWSVPPQPPPFEEFQTNYRSIFSDPAQDLYLPVDAPRITPPPPSSLFATSESESLANFLADFEDNSDFLFQPALPPGLPEFGLPPGAYDAGPMLQDAPMLPGTGPDLMVQDLPESQPPSPKRYKMEMAPPSAFMDTSTGFVEPPAVTYMPPLPSLPPSAAILQGGLPDQPHETASEAESSSRTRQTSRHSMGGTTSAGSPTASVSSHTSIDARSASKNKASLTDAEKRSNHIQSEQKRRNAIRDGFAELVTILQTGEPYSGLSIGYDGGDDGSGRKPRNRGRGRRGDHTAGASKSVVLGQAVRYVHWLQNGNYALEAEVARLESMVGG